MDRDAKTYKRANMKLRTIFFNRTYFWADICDLKTNSIIMNIRYELSPDFPRLNIPNKESVVFNSINSYLCCESLLVALAKQSTYNQNVYVVLNCSE